jgi:hypothetical protein
MNDAHFLKKLRYPDGFQPPPRLTHGTVVATAITRADLVDDVGGINASLDLIPKTRGGNWPTGPVTEDENYVDLVWHECEFRDGKSLTYVARDIAGAYVGCCYLYPLGSRTPLDERLLDCDCDVDVSWWVTPEAYDAGLYTQVYDALRHWLASEFPFWRAHYSNRELPDS